MQTLGSKVVQDLFVVYFLCQAKESVVRSRSAASDRTQETSVGGGKCDAVQLLE
ncbi:hypothetical protein M2163_000944 [Streptomyces sp. SAI-135]|nr:hypothetical protein [Streptomyces sp. SAI-090]MDH6554169.1 hypothetical protein [Streptomyces sp. SAI-041]MDH6573430.1 hypothetical protein [Streptomyces sp. SAI-117]MDH6613836.1 hypothetical protein [Streptomyces sp. SAI-135]